MQSIKVGFDFGTTYSSCTVVMGNRILPIKFDGSNQFSTAIYFPLEAPDQSLFNISANQAEIESAAKDLIIQNRDLIKHYDAWVRFETKSATQKKKQISKDKTQAEINREIKKIDRALQKRLEEKIRPKALTNEEAYKKGIDIIRRAWTKEQINREITIRDLSESDLKNALLGEAAINAHLRKSSKGIMIFNPKSMLSKDIGHRYMGVFEKAITIFFEKVITIIRDQTGLQENLDFIIGRPVHFNEHRGETGDKQAMGIIERAAKTAGAKSVIFLLEPEAAAYSVHRNLPEERRVLVVDLGGGTADISLADMGGNRSKPEIKRSSGRAHEVGGSDVDKWINLLGIMPFFGSGDASVNIPHAQAIYGSAALVHDIEAQKIFQEADISKFPAKYQRRLKKLQKAGNTIRLSRSAERAKIDLCKKTKTQVDLGFIGPGNSLELDRRLYDLAMATYLDRLKNLLLTYNEEDFDEIALTGGMSQARGIDELVKNLFPNKAIIKTKSGMDVAHGLALYGKEMDLKNKGAQNPVNNF